jgi:hypothetical protein
MMRSTALLFVIFADVSAVSLKPDDAQAIQVNAPRSTSLLSLLATRRKDIEKQMLELQQYSAANKGKISGDRDANYARLQKMATECKDCETAELALQKGYNESLAAHEYVEKVDADVLKQTLAEGVYNGSVKDQLVAEANRDKYEAKVFKEAQKAAMKTISGVGCASDSLIATYAPLSMPNNISYDVGPILADLNSKAKALRALQAIVVDKIAIVVKNNATFIQTQKDSIKLGLCPPSYCKPIDATNARVTSGLKDAALVGAEKTKTAECAAIDQEKWGVGQ